MNNSGQLSEHSEPVPEPGRLAVLHRAGRPRRDSRFRLSRCAALAMVWLAWSPGAGAATYQVGPTRVYHTVGALPALNAGDIVEVDPGTYNEVKRWQNGGTAANPLIIRGVGPARPLFDATNQVVDGVLPHPRAVFQVEANYITLENLEFKNARNGNNGAGIRVTGGNNVTIRNCRVTGCDMGMMCDNNSNLVVEASEIASNGTSLFDGYSHNFYLGGDSATVRFCYIHDSPYGQNFKTRAHYTELICNYIADSQDGEVGLVDAAATAATNSHAVMIGNIVISKPRVSGYNSARFIQFGQDSGGQHNGTLYAFNNTFVAGDGRIQFLSATAAGATILAANNIFYGSTHLAGALGGGITGSNNWAQSTAVLPATFFGTVQGSDPGFVNAPGRNVRLSAGSGCRDRGLDLLRYFDGAGLSHPGLPTLEYGNHLQHRDRPNDGRTDLGAYEYSPPRISGLHLNGSDSTLDVLTVPGQQYDLQRASDLGSNLWSPVATNLPGADGILQITDTNGGRQPQRFYRVRTSP